MENRAGAWLFTGNKNRFIIHPHDTVTVPNAEECGGKAKSCCYTAAVVLY